jgi:hypothetical protein
MPRFTTQVEHPLDQQTAVDRLKGLLGGLQSKYKDVASDVQGTWTSNVLEFSLKVMGFSITGKVTVLDRLATVEGNIPLAAVMFRGRIEESIKHEMQKELSAE